MGEPVRCLVTGSAGFLGSFVVEALVDRGHEVSCLVRKTSDLTWLKSLPVRLVYGDVAEADSLPAAVAGVDYVYHVAGVTKVLRDVDYFRVNTGGTANVLRACLAAGGAYRRVVVVSSLSALGPPKDGRALVEDDPARPITPYGLSKHLAEALAASYALRLPVTVVRPPAIYGPRDHEGLLVYRWINRGLRPVPRGKSLFGLIHVRDLASGIVLAGEHPAALGRTYHLANDEPESLEGLSVLIAEALRRRPLTVRLPSAALTAAAGFSELAGKIRGRPQILDRNKALEATLSWICDSSRARGELGFRPAIGVREGIQETIDWYRQVGWLR